MLASKAIWRISGTRLEDRRSAELSSSALRRTGAAVGAALDKIDRRAIAARLATLANKTVR